MSMSHNNVLDFSIAFFGCTVEEDLYPAIAAADVTRLEAWLDGYREFASTSRLKSRNLEPGEIRPYFHTQSRWLPWARGGLDFEGETFALADEIKHRLLYSHSLAVDDELGLRLAVCIAKLKQSQYGLEARASLLDYANLLLHLAPLLRTDVLCMVSPAEYVEDAPSLSEHLSEELLALAEDEEFDLSELVAAAPPETRSDWQKVLNSGSDSDRRMLGLQNLVAACDRVASGAEACAHLPGKLTLYLPFRYDVKVMSLCLGTRTAQLLPSLSDAENVVIKHLTEMTLPGLESLDPVDLVAVRQSSEEFEAWRTSLRSALRSASATPPDLLDKDDETRRAFRDALADAQRRLEESLKRSRFGQGLKTGAVTFMCGSVSIGIAALFSPVAVTVAAAASLAGLAGSATLAGIAKAAEVKRQSSAERTAQEALVHHYAALMQ